MYWFWLVFVHHRKFTIRGVSTDLHRLPPYGPMHTYIWLWVEWCTTSQHERELWGSKPGGLVYTLCCSTLCLWPTWTAVFIRRSLREYRAFLAQLAGASSAAGNNTPRDQVLRGEPDLVSVVDPTSWLGIGVHIYMGGIGLQQIFIFLFVFVTIKFHRELLRQSPTDRIRQALVLLYVVYAALFLITVSPS